MKRTNGRFYLLSLVIIIASLIFMVVYNYASFYSNMSDNMDRIGSGNLMMVTEQLEGYLEKSRDVLNTTAVSVEYMMKQGADSDELQKFIVYESEKYKQNIDENFTGIYGVINGDYIDGLKWNPDKNYDPRERAWYKLAKEAEGETVLVSPYLDSQTGHIIISFSKLLYDKESVISVDIEMGKIQSITENIRINDVGYGFVVDKSGLVVAHNDSNEQGKNYLEDDAVMKQVLSKVNSGSTEYFEMLIDGERYRVFSDEVVDSWHVVMLVNNHELLSDVQMTLARNILMCCLIGALIITFYVATFNRMRRSMKAEYESNQKVEAMNKNIIKSLAKTIDAKDRYTNGHSARVADYSLELARRMGKSEEEQQTIYYAGLLHDVGKIRVSEDVINKPGKLTDSEFEQIKIHPVTGYHILKDIYADKSIATAAKFHHERYDGRGYPNGLKGENIPEIARIIGVADAYDAMASNRSYRQALPRDVVRSEIEKGKGTQFDPKIADIMLQMIDEDTEYAMKETDAGNVTILVVDDEPMNIEMIQHILSDEPMYEVIGATSGEEAVAIITQREISLVLLDINMPQMDGFETLSNIRRKSDVPVVFMTADKNLETIEKAAAYFVDDYITKPFFSLELKETVHSILNN